MSSENLNVTDITREHPVIDAIGNLLRNNKGRYVPSNILQDNGFDVDIAGYSLSEEIFKGIDYSIDTDVLDILYRPSIDIALINYNGATKQVQGIQATAVGQANMILLMSPEVNDSLIEYNPGNHPFNSILAIMYASRLIPLQP